MNYEGMELARTEELNPAKLFFDGSMKTLLDEIRSKLDNIKEEAAWDVTVESDRQEMISVAFKVSKMKSALKKLYDSEIADAKAKISKAQKVWKPAEATLESWRDEIKGPAKDYEAEQAKLEEQRIEKIKFKIERIRSMVTPGMGITKDVLQLKGLVESIENITIEPDEYFEFMTEANQKKQEALILATKELELRERLDREAEERRIEADKLAKEREEFEQKKKEQEAKEAEERQRKEAEEAKLAEERRKIEEEKAEIERQKQREKDARTQRRLDLIEKYDPNITELLVADLDDEQFNTLLLQSKNVFEQQEAERKEADAKAKISKAQKVWKPAEATEEKEAKESAERRERLRPDREKLEGFIQFLEEGITYPDVKSEEANNIIKLAKSGIESLATDLTIEIELL